MTVTAMWLGGPGEPDVCEWNGVSFPRGEAVELTDVFMIRKAKTNPAFVVDDTDGEKPTDRMAAARAAKAAKQAM